MAIDRNKKEQCWTVVRSKANIRNSSFGLLGLILTPPTRKREELFRRVNVSASCVLDALLSSLYVAKQIMCEKAPFVRPEEKRKEGSLPRKQLPFPRQRERREGINMQGEALL